MIGLVVNPVAGLGGSVGLKGTDGLVEQARALGAIPHAHERAALALRQLPPDLPIACAGGDMGETSMLLSVLKNYSEFLDLAKGKVLAGSSAGANIFSKFYFSNSKDAVFEGLGVLPIRLVCHYGSNKFPIKNDPLELMKGYSENLELVTLKDYEWRVFTLG